MRAQQVLILTDHPQTQSQFQWTDGLIFAFSAKLKISTKKKGFTFTKNMQENP